jgi:hypothetical protein
MRTFFVVAVMAVLAVVFVAQKRTQHQEASVTQKVSVAQTTSPRPVSEHNWMKRSLDRTNEVRREVAQQRKADGTR